ncbi:MAG: Lipopolysaccharide core biosynthesis protein RfaG [Nitrospirae bacterium]|nr:Lipopolysaccharide core biosynthesis protein RfaG [Nitrospirota bacterium]MCE7964293.1 glycosyltransferase [Nitrospira sp. NTP2]MCK6492630.1 glycosyltransferase family 4 protein [Nitrospira sp.]MEB2337299.1 glycosyltransferase family 4 protein [Nitrospirales bacterium]QOJ36634.1 MAG: glycosyltransferase family 4 protein [Nitrospira sp.]
MRVAFLIERLDPARGGMERSAYDFLIELTALGVETHVVTQSAVDAPTAVQVHELGQEGWTDELQYRHFVIRAQRFVAERPWDVVHAIRPCLSCDLYQPRGGLVKTGQIRTIAARTTFLSKALRRVGLFFDGKERLLVQLEQQLLTGPKAPMVVVPSHYVGCQVEQEYGSARVATKRIFNAVQISPPLGVNRATVRRRRRAEWNIPLDRPVAIFVGHNFRRKGLARAIEVLADRRCVDWYLLVVGRDAPTPYERRAERLGVASRVRMLGEQSDVAELYWAADACVLPTYNDPCSRTVLEALSLGVPCITTVFDGSSECITPGEQGFVLPRPEAGDLLAEALRTLRDESVRRRMSREAEGLAAMLSMRRHAAEVAQVYGEIAARRSVAQGLCLV